MYRKRLPDTRKTRIYGLRKSSFLAHMTFWVFSLFEKIFIVFSSLIGLNSLIRGQIVRSAACLIVMSGNSPD